MSLRKFRFFAEEIDQSQPFALADFEIPHIQRSLRLKVGTEIEVFDGKGCRSLAKIHAVSRREILAHFVADLSTPVQPVNLILAVAPPKGKRAVQLIEKLTELNTLAFIPLITDHGEWQKKNLAKDREAWQRRSIEACKQCHRDTVMDIRDCQTVSQLIEADLGVLRAYGAPTRAESMTKSLDPSQQSLVAIGPEGGWSSAEEEAFQQAHWQAWQIGHTVLRIETAAVAFASVFAALSGH